jgi:hypothetical protein
LAHPLNHAKSSARRFGGEPADFEALHKWFDQTKAHVADARHRMVLHNSFGIFLCEQMFGDRIELSNGKSIATRLVAEQHVREDFGFIPSLEQVLDGMPLEKWMFQGAQVQVLHRIDGKLKPKPEGREHVPISQSV